MIRLLGRALGRTLLFLGWLVLLLGALALGLEATGLTRALFEELAGARLASLGGTLSIGRLDVRWLESSLVARDVRLTDGGDLVTLERLRLDLRWTRGGPVLERVHVAGGRVHVTPGLYRGVRGILDDRPARTPSGPAAPRGLFEVYLSDLGLSVEAVGQELAIGTLDVALARGPEGGLVLAGSLRQPPVPGAQGERAVHLSGAEREPGVLELRASAPGLLLDPALLPAGGSAGWLRELAPRGRLRLDAGGVLDLTRGSARGHLRASLDQGSLRSPTSPHPLREVRLELDARYEPLPGQDPWEPRAWRALAEASCRWRDQEFAAGALLGPAARPGNLLEAWGHARGIAFDAQLIELSGGLRDLLDVEAGLMPEGASADLHAALRLRDELDPDAPLARSLELVLDADVARGTRLSYQGWPSRSGRPEPAFPLPAEVQRGRVVFARSGRMLRPDLLVVEGTVLHASGPARVVYQGSSPPRDMPPFAPGFGRPESDLLISSPLIAVDDGLRRAVAGLGEDPSLAGLWERYEPWGGRVGGSLRLSQRAELPQPALDLELDFHGTDAVLEALPVPLRGLEGRVQVRGDGRGDLGVAFALRGRADDTAEVRVAGRSRRFQERSGSARRTLDTLELKARGAEATGRELELLGELWPEVAAVRSALGLAGALDLDLERRRGREGGPESTQLEIRAAAIALDPPDAPLGLQGVRGRALVHILETPAAEGTEVPPVRVRTLVPALAGSLPGGARIAWRGAGLADEPGRGALLCSGLALDQAASLMGARDGAPRTPDDGDLELGGRVDFRADLDLGAPGQGGPRARIHLRDNRIGGAQGPRVDDLRGVVLLADGELRSERVRARLARTEVDFHDLVLRPSPGGADGAELETTLTARALPLDEAHLALFVDADAVELLVHELGGRGLLDLDGARLRLGGLGTDRPTVEFQGALLLSDVTATLGVPLSIRSAAAHVERLVLDEGGLRLHGRLQDLYGRVAGLELGPATLVASCVGTRLTVEDLSGTFERGWLRTLDRDQVARHSPALAVDLVPPHPFQLALEFSGVDVKRVLRGVFPANMADRGDLDAELRMTGSLDRLLDVRGAGSLELRHTRLWSIPVFRELFSQLGFDRTALFDKLSGSFRLEQGRIGLHDLEARSPLLKLVGDGWVDLDGGLRADLEVRYSLVDKLTPLRRLIYLVQNSLLRGVAIRGDLERPRVVLQGDLWSPFRSVGSRERRLPLPGFSGLPERF